MTDEFKYKVIEQLNLTDYNAIFDRCFGLEKLLATTRAELDVANDLIFQFHERIKREPKITVSMLELSYKIAKYLTPKIMIKEQGK